ncbi:MAG: HD domain-containing protein [Candidatus Heimdallarchaeaceae archaeon]
MSKKSGGSIPSKEECLVLLKKYNTPTNVIRHCLAVTDVAEKICREIQHINKELVIAGAMLHDIGRSVTHSLFHANEGAKILKHEGIDPRITEIVKNHIGTGITKEEAIQLGLPPEDYMPKTLEAVVVSYADNLTKGENASSFEQALERFIHRFGHDSHVVKGLYKQREIIEMNRKKGVK